jgi:hypothetical protein
MFELEIENGRMLLGVGRNILRVAEGVIAFYELKRRNCPANVAGFRSNPC